MLGLAIDPHQRDSHAGLFACARMCLTALHAWLKAAPETFVVTDYVNYPCRAPPAAAVL